PILTAAQLEPDGRPLGSRYLLDAPIGRGATGQVWRARRRDTGQTVAVKLLRAEYAEDPEVVVRFLRERSTLTGVSHPHLVAVHDLVAEGETLGIVMDLVDGADLRKEARESPLTRTEVCAAMSQVAAALDAVHAARIVHRDLKPENVLVERRRPDMFVRLTDFGVARAADGPSLTRLTRVVGTPAYIAPEVVSGRQPGPEGDVYALGVTAYELIARRRPFEEHTTAALLRAHLDTMPTKPAEMDDMLWQVVAACLDKDPARRPTAAQLGHTFGALASGQAISPWAPGAAAASAQPVADNAPQSTQWIWIPPAPAPAPVSPSGAGPASPDHMDTPTKLISSSSPSQPPPGQPPPGQPPPGQPSPGQPLPGHGPPNGYPPGPVPPSGAQPPVGHWRRDGPDPYAGASGGSVNGPAASAARRSGRRVWWLVGGVAALVALLGIGGGIWAGRPAPAPSTQPTPASAGRLVYVPVEAVSPTAGTVRLRFSGGEDLAGFQSYTVLMDGNPLQNGIEDQEYLVEPIDTTGVHCYSVVALVVATSVPSGPGLSTTPQKRCLLADGKGVPAR
ncbi:MAG TPA: protein kinase, partial [Cryptosporangiaceae bacterium]|nr:protein kinase [Cryptosporangiaceae bacterium]